MPPFLATAKITPMLINCPAQVGALAPEQY
jgi:hypothetical protein